MTLIIFLLKIMLAVTFGRSCCPNGNINSAGSAHFAISHKFVIFIAQPMGLKDFSVLLFQLCHKWWYLNNFFLFCFRSFNQRSVPGSVMFFNQCRKFQTFLWIRRYSQSQIDPCRWGIGITGQLTGFVPVCRTWWRSWAFTWWWGQEKTCSSWYPQVSATCKSSKFFFFN